jgi:hypothetical protein
MALRSYVRTEAITVDSQPALIAVNRSSGCHRRLVIRPSKQTNRVGLRLYERFCPAVPEGT